MTDEAFASGMASLGLAFGVEADVAVNELWHMATRHLSDAEWDAAVIRTVQSVTTTYGKFPAPGLLLAHAQPELPGEAATAYDRVLASGVYTAEGGTTWSYRSIAAACGRAAAEAFLAAGGDSAFRSTFRESDRRERFLAAYQQAAREAPSSRLLPAAEPERPQIAAPEITASEAVSVLHRITGEPAKPMRAPRRLTAGEVEDRLELLRAQAERITADERAAEAVAEEA